MAVLAGKKKIGQQLAGKSTLNRMELVPDGDALKERYCRISYSAEAIDELLVTLYPESQARAPRRIVLDLDSTDVPLHGQQEKRFFHGYYNHYCYLPLYIFCGDHLLRARLRPANIDGSAGSLDEVQAVVAQIRARWPKTQIILRADSGFCRDELMNWCEANGVDDVIGFARNGRLRTLIEPQMQQAQAEQLEGKENPRYVVTTLGTEAWPARLLYEKLYCERGEMENRIKEQMSLFADRLSTETLRSNQLRLYLSSLAYVLVCGLRRLALKGSQWAEAQVGTIRLRLLKVAARVTVTARRVWVSYSSAYAWRSQFEAAFSALQT